MNNKFPLCPSLPVTTFAAGWSLPSLVVCLLFGFDGCVPEPNLHVGPAPALPTSMASTVFATQAPPAMQEEVVLSRPLSLHAWLPGYWTWRNDRYEWMAGHWELPPSSGSVWRAPRWEQEGASYRFYEGYWN